MPKPLPARLDPFQNIVNVSGGYFVLMTFSWTDVSYTAASQWMSTDTVIVGGGLGGGHMVDNSPGVPATVTVNTMQVTMTETTVNTPTVVIEKFAMPDEFAGYYDFNEGFVPNGVGVWQANSGQWEGNVTLKGLPAIMLNRYTKSFLFRGTPNDPTQTQTPTPIRFHAKLDSFTGTVPAFFPVSDKFPSQRRNLYTAPQPNFIEANVYDATNCVYYPADPITPLRKLLPNGDPDPNGIPDQISETVAPGFFGLFTWEITNSDQKFGFFNSGDQVQLKFERRPFPTRASGLTPEDTLPTDPDLLQQVPMAWFYAPPQKNIPGSVNTPAAPYVGQYGIFIIEDKTGDIYPPPGNNYDIAMGMPPNSKPYYDQP
jgi:hypothetical protein